MLKNKLIYKITTFCLISTISFGISGCKSDKSVDTEFVYKDSESTEYSYFEEQVVKNNEILLYHVYKENLGLYNTDTKTWEPIYDSKKNNLFAYSVKGQEYDNTFYTIGSSSFNDFSVVKYNRENHIAESIYNVAETDSLIPIGYYKDKMYFIHNLNDLENSESRALAYLDSGNIADFLNLNTSLVSNAVIVKDELYYVIYDESNDIYELYDYSLVNNSSTYISKIYTDLIYRYGDMVTYIDENNKLVDIYGNVYYSIKENSNVEILSDYGLLIQVYVSEANDIACDIINLKNQMVISTKEKFDGYTIEDSKLNLYCEGQIESMEIEYNYEWYYFVGWNWF